jgi:glyoxylase-like metal-dependent hydrolase (beta-lactamase superfamily II)
MVHGSIPYPPVDTTCHGIASLMAKRKPEPAAVALPGAVCIDGGCPVNGWEILALPGHTPGSIGLFRAADGVLLAGDALSTIDWDQMIPMWRQTKQLRMPPNLDTLDWVAVRRSLRLMASVKPQRVIPAHGEPLLTCEQGVAEEAWHLAEVGIVARKGRYVADPAVLRADNTWQLYDPIPDPIGKFGKLAVLAGIAIYVFFIIRLW